MPKRELPKADPIKSSAALAANLAVKEGVVASFNPPPITGLSTTGGVEAYLQSRGGAGSQAPR